MQLTPSSSGPRTAIPPRFRLQRERVLRILARWERSTRFAANSYEAALPGVGES